MQDWFARDTNKKSWVKMSSPFYKAKHSKALKQLQHDKKIHDQYVLNTNIKASTIHWWAKIFVLGADQGLNCALATVFWSNITRITLGMEISPVTDSAV